MNKIKFNDQTEQLQASDNESILSIIASAWRELLGKTEKRHCELCEQTRRDVENIIYIQDYNHNGEDVIALMVHNTMVRYIGRSNVKDPDGYYLQGDVNSLLDVMARMRQAEYQRMKNERGL